MAITDYSQTAASNTELNGLNVTGHSIPAGADDLVRQIMADLADLVNGGLTIADLGVVSTVDINGGTVDGVIIGGASAAAGSFTTIGATGLATLANVDINAGNIDGTAIGSTTPAAGSFTTLTSSGETNINGGELRVTSTAPVLRLIESDGSTTHAQTVVARSSDQLFIQTRDNTGGGNHTNYRMTDGADGATEHRFYIESSPVLDVVAAGITSTGIVKTATTTVASLPSAATVGAGSWHFVTDATSTTFASTVAGGGANSVPVYSDGTNWKIG